MTLLDILFPRRCLQCGTMGGYICPSCLQSLAVIEMQKCPMCERASVSGLTHARCKKALGMDGLVSGFAYRGLLKRMVKTYKYRLVSDLLDDLVNLWVSLAEMELIAAREPMIITSVPLHPTRLRYRGYNQAALLGKALANYLGWEYVELLERRMATIPQSQLSRNERAHNMQGVFGILEEKDVRDAALLLVDDIWTTGTTMRACARILKQAGARSVWGMTLAA